MYLDQEQPRPGTTGAALCVLDGFLGQREDKESGLVRVQDEEQGEKKKRSEKRETRGKSE